MDLLKGATVAVMAMAQDWMVGDDLIHLYYAMPYNQRQRGDCVFILHPETMALIISIKTGDGRYVYGDLSEMPPITLLGCPVREDETMPRVGPGARSVLFVDYGCTGGERPVAPVLCLEHPE